MRFWAPEGPLGRPESAEQRMDQRMPGGQQPTDLRTTRGHPMDWLGGRRHALGSLFSGGARQRPIYTIQTCRAIGSTEAFCQRTHMRTYTLPQRWHFTTASPVFGGSSPRAFLCPLEARCLCRVLSSSTMSMSQGSQCHLERFSISETVGKQRWTYKRFAWRNVLLHLLFPAPRCRLLALRRRLGRRAGPVALRLLLNLRERLAPLSRSLFRVFIVVLLAGVVYRPLGSKSL